MKIMGFALIISAALVLVAWLTMSLRRDQVHAHGGGIPLCRYAQFFGEVRRWDTTEGMWRLLK